MDHVRAQLLLGYFCDSRTHRVIARSLMPTALRNRTAAWCGRKALAPIWIQNRDAGTIELSNGVKVRVDWFYRSPDGHLAWKVKQVNP